MKLLVPLFLSALLLAGGRAGPAEDREGAVPRQPDARSQLELAGRCKRELRGRLGEARRAARSRAVAAYRAVCTYHPRESALGAEAAFRAGELLRSAGDERGALEEFARARRLGAGTSFPARAGLEIGHIHRRRGRWMSALAAYEELFTGDGVDPKTRDRATYWAGRTHESLGRPRDARRCWERLARQGTDPVDRVRAFDAWSRSKIDEGDLEGAAGVIQLCRTSLRDVALEETELGSRVRAALERMRSVELLARAVEVRMREGGELPGGRCPDDPRPPPARVVPGRRLLPLPFFPERRRTHPPA